MCFFFLSPSRDCAVARLILDTKADSCVHAGYHDFAEACSPFALICDAHLCEPPVGEISSRGGRSGEM